MKIHHDDDDNNKGRSVFKTDKVLSYSPEHRRGKLEMEEDTFLEDKGRKMDSRDEKGSRRRRFTRAVRAVLFHIKLRRKNGEKRIGSDSMRSNSSCSFRFRKRNHDMELLTKSASTSSSSVLSSSRLSFQLSEPRTSVSSVNQNPKPPKQSSLRKQLVNEQSSLKKQGRSSGAIVIGLMLILMSLASVILWGKLWAIALNSMWLACIPQKRVLRLRQRGEGGDMDRMEEEPVKERRRRVIMEGLLDRGHYHHQQQQKL